MRVNHKLNFSLSTLKIASRKSDLARIQAYLVGNALKIKYPDIKIEYFFKESLGDKNLTDPLWKIPEKGVFTEDFMQDLCSRKVDMVVHSWKDLPTEEKKDTVVCATLKRADQRDILLVKKNHFSQISESKSLRIYSSSPRREYNLSSFLKTALPIEISNVSFHSVRGNILTRIQKLCAEDSIDGLIIAKAAIDRLLTIDFFDDGKLSASKENLITALKEFQWMVIPLSINPNAAAQGAIAIEVLKSRTDLIDLLENINHSDSYYCAKKEREILSQYGGGCHQKIGVSVLKKNFGDVLIVKGLTDSGQILDQAKILSNESNHSLDSLNQNIKFNQNESWSEKSSLAFERQ